MAGAQFLSLILVGVVAGSFVGTQLGQVRVQNALDARDFTLVKHGFEVAIGGVMPVLVIGSGVSIALVVVLVATNRRGPVLVLSALALLLWIAVIGVTLRYNVPVNKLAADWDPASPPEDWEALRDQWHFGHTVRTPLAVGSFACLAMGAVWPQLVR
ncbi:DUF1772 domain-containing protein [Rhodococcus sp. DMU1]|uniref:DUF1772 domain-containing protein n=1 Tax=Rhodococcus sp. DMU1 TaxID=2722825 RepID=UPI00143E984A|nr:DUF1772 domain-containing protein [Rhodococcus sp. DMU1]QIX53540.1 DUF1772 domain-containing protein [Rhodococcus sp. DMU1]